MFSRLFFAESFAPDLFSAPIKCEDRIQVVGWSSEIDLVFPYYGRGITFAGQRDFPKDLVRLPFGWVFAAFDTAEILRAAPMRPVLFGRSEIQRKERKEGRNFQSQMA